jgi:hypothetical protein
MILSTAIAPVIMLALAASPSADAPLLAKQNTTKSVEKRVVCSKEAITGSRRTKRVCREVGIRKDRVSANQADKQKTSQSSNKS